MVMALSSTSEDFVLPLLKSLANLPELRRLSLKVEKADDDEWETPEEDVFVALPKLVALSIEFRNRMESAGIAYFLAHLDAPALESLDVEVGIHHDLVHHYSEMFDNIARGSNGNLERFRYVDETESINGVVDSSSAFKQMLRRMPNLQVLQLKQSQLVTDATLTDLFTPSLFPCLRSLDVRGCDAITDEGLRACLADREGEEKGFTLQTLAIKDCSQVSPAFATWERAFRA